MFDLTRELFIAETFMPHGNCLLWQPGLVWLHILSDSAIALAYYCIPITLFYFVEKRKDLAFNWVFILFATFIIACGTSHWIEVWTLWHPIYWFSGGVKVITALVSLSTAIALVAIMPTVLKIPNPRELEIANWALQQALTDRKQIEAELLQSQELREVIFHESADALFLVDPQTLLTLDCNRRAVELFQATEKTKLIGIAGHILQRYQFSQDELDEIVMEMQSKGFWSRELEYMTYQGNPFWGNLAAKPITVAGRTLNLVRVTDISDRKQAELRLQASLREKEVLLKEIHHRVKNNLQIVYSLLRLQHRKLKDQAAANALLESQNRIESIALIHEKLYQSENLAQINMAEYIPSLASNLFSTYNISHQQIELRTEIEPILLNVDKAIHCGLIINELVTNSLKYAFSALSQCSLCIYIGLQRLESSRLTLMIRDNGIGIPDSVNLLQLETLGLQLVQGFAKQLKGTFHINCHGGTEIQIVFPGADL